MANVVKVTSKGTFSPALTRQGIKPANLGRFDPSTGRVYQHPRLRLNPLRGRNVQVTNPAASNIGRTASLGMGGVGQRGRVQDVGASADD